MMSDSTKITPVGVVTAGLAGSAVGSIVPAGAKYTAEKIKDTKVDKFVKGKLESAKVINNEIKSRLKNAWAALFPKNTSKKIVEQQKGFKGFLKKAIKNTKLFTEKHISPILKHLKNPGVSFPIIGAIAGIATYIATNKIKENNELNNLYY